MSRGFLVHQPDRLVCCFVLQTWFSSGGKLDQVCNSDSWYVVELSLSFSADDEIAVITGQSLVRSGHQVHAMMQRHFDQGFLATKTAELAVLGGARIMAFAVMWMSFAVGSFSSVDQRIGSNGFDH